MLDCEMWSFITGTKRNYVDKSTQTVIHRKYRKDLNLKPDEEEKLFFSLLEYTPIQDIQGTHIAIINLAKPQQSSSSTVNKSNKSQILVDDDGVQDLFLQLSARKRKGYKKVLGVLYQDQDTQTMLHAQPHILPNDQVASVSADASTQTGSLTKKSPKGADDI